MSQNLPVNRRICLACSRHEVYQRANKLPSRPTTKPELLESLLLSSFSAIRVRKRHTTYFQTIAKTIAPKEIDLGAIEEE